VPSRRLIVCADDFGRDLAVNEAVEIAHRDGILSTASLMVAAPEAADAVQRARRLPGLRVGLHLVLVDGAAVLPPGDIAGLVAPDGRFVMIDAGPDPPEPPRMVVVLDWLDELRRLVPSR